MTEPQLDAILFSFLSGGRCENALLERFGSALSCPSPGHADFWRLRALALSDLPRLLAFDQPSSAWVDAFPVVVAAAWHTIDPDEALVRSQVKALLQTQDRQCVGAALRALEFVMRALPQGKVAPEWTELLQYLLALKASLSDINLPHAIDALLGLFLTRHSSSDGQVLAFFRSGHNCTAELVCSDAVFPILRESARLSAKESLPLVLPFFPLPSLEEGKITTGQVARLSCLLLLQQRHEAISELLVFVEKHWSLSSLWGVILDCAQFFTYTGQIFPADQAFIAFSLKFVHVCLDDSLEFKRRLISLETILKTFQGGEAGEQLSLKLSLKFRDLLKYRFDNIMDLGRLLKVTTLSPSLALETLEAIIESWDPLLLCNSLKSNTGLSIFCDLLLVLVKGTFNPKSPSNLDVASCCVLRLLEKVLATINDLMRDPDKAYGCHFFMFLWRDTVSEPNFAHGTERKQLLEVLEAGLTCQNSYSDISCELDHLHSPCFALLQGVSTLSSVTGPSPEMACVCEHICELFSQRTVDDAFINSMLSLVLRCPEKRREHMLLTLAHLAEDMDQVRLEEVTLELLLSSFIALPEPQPQHPLGRLLRVTFRELPQTESDVVLKAKEKMGAAWADITDCETARLCSHCGEDLEGLCWDVESALKAPLNLDCVGD